MKPYYQDDAVTIYHGDCREVLPTLDPVDLIFTSPPYNLSVTTGGGFGHGTNWNGKWNKAARVGGIGKGYDDHDDAMLGPEYEAWQQDILRLCWAQLTDQGAIFYNHKPRVQAKTLWTPLALNPGLPLRQIIIWARAGGVNFAPTHYCPTHEWIMVLARDAFRLTSRGASGVGDVWRVAQDGDNEHPAPFPLALPARAIESMGPASVLDPFMGSGTTLRAAKNAGVRAVGIELSERYCELAARRMGQEVMDFGAAA